MQKRGTPLKKSQSKHFNWSSIAKQEQPKQFSQVSSTTSFQFLRTKGTLPNQDRTVDKLESGLCWWNTDVNEETGEGPEQASNWKGSPDQITADVECLEKLARSLFVICWDMNFSEEWLCSVTVVAPKVVGVTYLSKFRPTVGKILGYVWVNALPPRRYESVHTAFVPKAHADAGLFLLLRAAELSREWQKEIAVVQLEVKKEFDHVDHYAVFKALRLRSLRPFSIPLVAAIWNGSCMKARLGTVLSNNVQMSRGLHPGCTRVSCHFHNDHGAGSERELNKLWKILKLAWSLDDFVLAAICCADVVVLVAASVAAADVMVAEVIAKLKEVNLTVGAEKTHRTSHPKLMDTRIGVDLLAVLWEEVQEFVGSKVCLDGNARYAIAHCSAQANKCLAKWRPVLSSSWLPRKLRLNIVKTTMSQSFLWSSRERTTVKAQRDKIASRSARMEAIVIGPKKPPWMEIDQWWRLWHRTGHRWIGKCNMNVLTAIRERVLSSGWSRCQNGLLKDLREGLEMPGTSVVEMVTTPLERSGEGHVGWSAPKTIQNLQMGGRGVDGGLQVFWNCRRHCGISPFVHRLFAARSGSWAMATEKARSRRGQCEDAVEMHQPLRGSKRTQRIRPASIGAEWWSWLRVASNDVERLVQVEQNEKEREEEFCCAPDTPLSASNQERFLIRVFMVQCWIWLVGALCKNGCRRDSWKKCSEDEWNCLVQCGVLALRLEIQLESAKLERPGMERRYDSPCSDADFHAHAWDAAIIGVIVGVNGAHEQEIEMPSKEQKSAMGGQKKID